MIEGHSPVFQAFMGTLFTWGLTAAGAGLVFIFSSGQRKVLDGSLGFAAGVMTAASYWSLLAPAIEMAQDSGQYGEKGEWAFVPVAIGFILGAAFVYYADLLMPYLGVESPNIALALASGPKFRKDDEEAVEPEQNNAELYQFKDGAGDLRKPTPSYQRRKRPTEDGFTNSISDNSSKEGDVQQTINWKRIMLLIIAITVHNIPEGLAVGVGFGAIGKTKSATFENARNLAIGIGIQNFPEGLAVSLPLRGSGFSTFKSFWWGQLSGMVEPIAGVLGALAVGIAEPILPYALAFAAGAMIYVVADDIIPEAQTCGNGKLASCGVIIGFVVMMALDVGLG